MNTVEKILRKTTRQLEESAVYFGHGTDNALDEAAYVIAHVTGIPLDFDESYLQQPVAESHLEKIHEIINQRIAERKPVAYITHEAWFAGLKFYVDERVLVPRSPIAELIQELFSPWIETNNVKHILDLCTGSGCIGIASAYAFPAANVTLSDVDKGALCVAGKNVVMHKLEARTQLYESNLFATIPAQKYDIIVSNPPYVDAHDMATMPDEYRHEPELGLTAGDDGLDLVEIILRQSADYLSPLGILIVEVGNSAEALVEKYPDAPFTWLEFEYGGHGVFLLTAEQVSDYFR